MSLSATTVDVSLLLKSRLAAIPPFQNLKSNCFNIVLKSNDEKEYQVDYDIAVYSITIQNVIAEFKDETSCIDIGAIPLPNVSSFAIENIITWITYHYENNDFVKYKVEKETIKECIDNPDITTHNHGMYERFQRIKRPISEWDQEFFSNFTFDQNVELLLAANYLDIKMMINTISKYIASIWRSKSIQEIKSFHGFDREFTPLEIANVEEKYPWLKLNC